MLVKRLEEQQQSTLDIPEKSKTKSNQESGDKTLSALKKEEKKRG